MHTDDRYIAPYRYIKTFDESMRSIWFIQTKLPKLSTRIRGTYIFRTSYTTAGTLHDRVGYLREIVIERTRKIDRILDNHCGSMVTRKIL